MLKNSLKRFFFLLGTNCYFRWFPCCILYNEKHFRHDFNYMARLKYKISFLSSQLRLYRDDKKIFSIKIQPKIEIEICQNKPETDNRLGCQSSTNHYNWIDPSDNDSINFTTEQNFLYVQLPLTAFTWKTAISSIKGLNDMR